MAVHSMLCLLGNGKFSIIRQDIALKARFTLVTGLVKKKHHDVCGDGTFLALQQSHMIKFTC